MDSGGNEDDDDDDWMFSPRLPAVIPIPRLPIVMPLTRRFVVPFWGLILMATAGSVMAGALAATVWPWEYHNKTTAAAVGPGNTDMLGDGNAEDSNATAGEVTKIDLAGGNPLNVSHAALNTTGLGGSKQVMVEPTIAPAPAAPAQLAPPVQIFPAPDKPAAVEPSAQTARDACRVKPSGPQLVLNSQRTVLRLDEPASLGLTVDGTPDGASLLVCGFADQSMFSVGHALDDNIWLVPAAMIADATIMPPHGFVGPMDLGVTLMSADGRLADRKTIHLQWQPLALSAPQMSPRLEFSRYDSLLSHAAHLKAIGNLADARQIFTRVAQSGDPRGAFLLAETYDPISLAKHQLLPRDSDLELARVWYRKASELGSAAAAGRLERLTNW